MDPQIGSLLMLVAMFAIFYFLIIRPQQKRVKDHREMVEALRKGDVVVTNGGIIGKIVRVHDDELTLELADNVRVKSLRAMVAEVRAKTEPAARDDDESAD